MSGGYRGGERSNGCRLYVGNLPGDVREREIDDLFYKYGRIRDISIKGGSQGPAFAFVEFDDSRDAEDAIRGRDGYDFDRNRIRVEMAGRPGGGRDGGGGCLLYTSDAADEEDSVDLGGRRIIKKKKKKRFDRLTIAHLKTVHTESAYIKFSTIE
eukprot:TRINITY_DN317_c0_g1_i2.p2 TRINITY_DN317_c0_g1~~TRINITY_DN317_c0_g1_i2.p2  ORF type:complete len:155 (-),score=26.86 TRINITY_DN317_c0_g1_i2:53-517(-)